jgi:hypothetical protein
MEAEATCVRGGAGTPQGSAGILTLARATRMPPPSPIEVDDVMLVQASSRIVSCELEGEAVLLDPQAGLYFGLNDVGAAIWTMLASPCRLSDLYGAVVNRFDVDEDTCRDDVRTLVEELLARGLAVVVAPRA